MDLCHCAHNWEYLLHKLRSKVGISYELEVVKLVLVCYYGFGVLLWQLITGGVWGMNLIAQKAIKQTNTPTWGLSKSHWNRHCCPNFLSHPLWVLNNNFFNASDTVCELFMKGAATKTPLALLTLISCKVGRQLLRYRDQCLRFIHIERKGPKKRHRFEKSP